MNKPSRYNTMVIREGAKMENKLWFKHDPLFVEFTQRTLDKPDHFRHGKIPCVILSL